MPALQAWAFTDALVDHSDADARAASAPEVCAYYGVPRHGRRRRLLLTHGQVNFAEEGVIVHAAAPGLPVRPPVPIGRPEAITSQPVRAGFPCFGAALVGYVEATIDSDDDKNRLCPPSPHSDTPADWARMQVLGYRASQAFLSHPDIRAWVNSVPLYPARIPHDTPPTRELTATLQRLRTHGQAGMTRMAELAGIT